MGKIHITKGLGKMEDMHSINTSTLENKFCQQNQKTSEICKICYALKYEKMRPALEKALLRNDEVFLSKDFQPEFILFHTIRLHSFGELKNSLHFENLIKLIKFNSRTHFTLWTKRANIVQKWIKENGELPKNLLLVFSNSSLNNERKIPPKGFHMVFNVFEEKYAKENNIKINCHSKCVECMKCYSWDTTTRYINELKKKK